MSRIHVRALFHRPAPVLVSAGLLCGLSGCAPQEAGAEQTGPVESQVGSFPWAMPLAAPSAGVVVQGIQREVVAGDVAHYSVVLKVGDGPNARLVLHRVVREEAPWWPEATPGAVMLLSAAWRLLKAPIAARLSALRG